MYEFPCFLLGVVAGIGILQVLGVVKVIPNFFDKVPHGEIKLVLVVNNELELKRSQLVNCVTCTVIDAYQKTSNSNTYCVSLWKNMGQPKIVVKSNTQGIGKAIKGAYAAGVPVVSVPIIEGGNPAVAAFGPAPSCLVDKVTGEFKLL